MEKIVICDIDGTLADLTHRRFYIEKRPKDWDSFFGAAYRDTPITANVAVLNALAKSYRIILVSGRPERTREKTEWWLTKHGILYYQLFMRPDGDRRDDNIIKSEILQNHILTSGITLKDIKLVIDDRPRVIEMWRKMDLDVLDVGDGIDF